MPPRKEEPLLRYSVSLVTQGHHRFYTLSMPSDILAKACFVSTRDEDPRQGFQRLLDKKRAAEIATYIDNGLGTIPTSIILSAQPEADLQVVGRGKTLEFKLTEKSFLILDGQHRVYGFSLAKTALRVPVVIYNGLSRRDESRLFIDINTRQRPVSNELLLDIKKLAEYESETEQILRELFDLFNSDNNSPLLGMLTASKKMYNKITRVTFNSAMKPLVPIFIDKDNQSIYEALSAYLQAFIYGLKSIKLEKKITNPYVFKAMLNVFPEIAQRVQDRYGKVYTYDNYHDIMHTMYPKIKASMVSNPGRSHKTLADHFTKAFKTDLTL
jgi:DGQHR domain-containing protein